MKGVLEKARRAREAALKLANLPDERRVGALLQMAEEVRRRGDELLAANRKDLAAAEGKVSKAFFQRLKLSREKIEEIARMIESVARLPDPLGRTVYAMEMDEGLEVYKVTCPIGVIGAVFEARPDVLPQISALCLRSGNAVILKGGKEAANSNRAMYNLVKEVTEKAGVPAGWIQLIEAREEVVKLLKLSDFIDLLIPRGSKEFVEFIQKNTTIPVLGHAAGVCHVYVDRAADVEKAVKIAYDAKVQYPAVCNAMESLLVHSEIAEEFLPRIAERYSKAGVEMRGCPKTLKILKGIKKASAKDWGREYLDLVVSIKVVDSIDEAIEHINRYGTKHTDAIVTESKEAALKFLREVDSSSVMVNASTRFSDGYRYGLGAEVGISTGKIHARGPVGLEGLTTTKYFVVGNGHVVADYVGVDARRFTHRPLAKKWEEAIQ
ncbi:MAG: glutamate-5-semialdehyde dehydrogenase [Candidatus Hadarchaeales archaeon]